MVFEFLNNLGWFAFLSLIPFIIIYLIKPTPSTLKVPSLMFFMQHTKQSKAASWLKYLFRDLLFLLQLLVLLLLSFTITQPFFSAFTDVVSDNIVFVLDTSASSKVLEDKDLSRFDIAKEKIEEFATSENSLVLLKSEPILALQGVSKGELKRYLSRLEPSDDVTDISSAISLAGTLLEKDQGRIVVVSDFANSKGSDFINSKSLVESKGVDVDLVDTKISNRSNLGIVDMIISEDTVNLYIKNFNNKTEKVSLKFNNELKEININANEVEPFVFKLKDNLTRVEIVNKDDFLIDNSVTIVKPYSNSINVLYIANTPSKYIKAVLNSIDNLNLVIATPPVVPKGDYDLYIIGDVNKKDIVFDTFGAIKRDVEENGKAAIILSNPHIKDIDFEGLITLNFNDLVNGGSTSINQINKFTKDVEFGEVKKVYSVESKGNVIVETSNQSVVELFKLGKGKTVYYGIMEHYSDFHLTPSYPFFWNNLIRFLLDRKDLNEVNLKAGDTLVLDNQTIVLDKVGVYDVNNAKFAMNLLNEKESDINFVYQNKDIEYSGSELERVKTEVDYDLNFYITILVTFLVLIEFIYIKFRGEI